MIRANAHRYPITAMCRILQVSRSQVYRYQPPSPPQPDPLEEVVIRIFRDHQRVYGTRKLKAKCVEEGYPISRRRISRIMKANNLVSAYTVKKYRVMTTDVNHAQTANVLDRQFDQKADYEVLVSDLTYVRVKEDWNYICIIVNLYNREIVGYAAGPHHDSELVKEAVAAIRFPLQRVSMFHSDRGGEFKSYQLDEILESYEIQRSLSRKGNPFDNAVAEATFKIIKTEFVRGRGFNDLEHLKMELAAYVHWFNHKRIHSSLGYLSPIQFRQRFS